MVTQRNALVATDCQKRTKDLSTALMGIADHSGKKIYFINSTEKNYQNEEKICMNIFKVNSHIICK